MPKHCEGLRRHRGILRPPPFVLSADEDPDVPADESPPPRAEAPGCCPGSQGRRGVRLGALRSQGSPASPPPFAYGNDGVTPTKSDPGRLAGQTPTASSEGGTWSPSKVTKTGRNSHLIWFICYNDSSPWAILNTSVIFASKTLLQGS